MNQPARGVRGEGHRFVDALRHRNIMRSVESPRLVAVPEGESENGECDGPDREQL